MVSRRSIPRFSLRRLLLAVVVLSLLFAAIGAWIRAGHRQQRIVAKISAFNGYVDYLPERQLRDPDDLDSAVTTWHDLCGIALFLLTGRHCHDYIQHVGTVNLSYVCDHDDIWHDLHELPRMKTLSIRHSQLTDEGFLRLAQYKQLRELEIVSGHPISAAAQARFQRHLPTCRLSTP